MSNHSSPETIYTVLSYDDNEVVLRDELGAEVHISRSLLSHHITVGERLSIEVMPEEEAKLRRHQTAKELLQALLKDQ